jgi:hypothetical protein
MKKVLLLISLFGICWTILYCQSKPFAYIKFISFTESDKDTCKGYIFKIIDEETKQPLNSCYIQCGRDSTLGSYTDENGFSSCISGIDKTKPINCDVTDLYRIYQAKRFYIAPMSKDTLVLEMKKQ